MKYQVFYEAKYALSEYDNECPCYYLCAVWLLLFNQNCYPHVMFVKIVIITIAIKISRVYEYNLY